jgi:Cu(I)/Ag(I) efflux system membrane protein CusA/SilA
VAILVGLLAIMWSHGVDVIKRIAAPMSGGVISSFLLELIVYPAISEVWRGREVKATSNAQ